MITINDVYTFKNEVEYATQRLDRAFHEVFHVDQRVRWLSSKGNWQEGRVLGILYSQELRVINDKSGKISDIKLWQTPEPIKE